jgi:hypothetical protein
MRERPTLIIQDDEEDEQLWTKIKPPWPRMNPRHHVRYVRSELGRVLCQEFAEFECVAVTCPAEHPDDDEFGHIATICRHGSDCDNVAIRCHEGHSSSEVIEAIIERLRD